MIDTFIEYLDDEVSVFIRQCNGDWGHLHFFVSRLSTIVRYVYAYLKLYSGIISNTKKNWMSRLRQEKVLFFTNFRSGTHCPRLFIYSINLVLYLQES